MKPLFAIAMGLISALFLTELSADSDSVGAGVVSEIPDAENYTTLAPASPEILQFTMQMHQDEMKMLLDVVEKNRTDPERLQKIIERLRRISTEHPYPLDIEFIERLKPEDNVFFFEYETGGENSKYRDKGILVVREGEIVYRRPIRSRTIKDSSEDDGALTIQANMDEL